MNSSYLYQCMKVSWCPAGQHFVSGLVLPTAGHLKRGLGHSRESFLARPRQLVLLLSRLDLGAYTGALVPLYPVFRPGFCASVLAAFSPSFSGIRSRCCLFIAIHRLNLKVWSVETSNWCAGVRLSYLPGKPFFGSPSEHARLGHPTGCWRSLTHVRFPPSRPCHAFRCRLT